MFRNVLELDLFPGDGVPEEVKDAINTWMTDNEGSYQFWFNVSWFVDENGLVAEAREDVTIICNYLLSHNVTKCYIST